MRTAQTPALRVLLVSLFVALSLPAGAAEPLHAYIGTWTPDPSRKLTPEENHGQGIYGVSANPANGFLGKPSLVAKTPSATWITASKDGRFLYATNDVSRFDGEASGSVSAFAIDPATGALRPLGSVSAHGLSPCFISVDRSGKYLLVADYLGGAFVVLPIRADGSLGNATDIQRPTGPRSPDRAADNPPGNFAISDHSMSRAHMIEADPSGKFIVTDDAGLDQIRVWTLDTAHGKLIPVPGRVFPMTPGSAPRHFVFSPDGRYLFQAFEQDSMLASYAFDAKTGELRLLQKLSTLPRGFAGSNLISEILISGDGRNLYVANRTFDTIAAFSLDAQGHIALIGEEPTRGDTPRSLCLDPSGRVLYSLNQKADSVTVYNRDPQAGRLGFAGQFLPLGSPATMLFSARHR